MGASHIAQANQAEFYSSFFTQGCNLLNKNTELIHISRENETGSMYWTPFPLFIFYVGFKTPAFS